MAPSPDIKTFDTPMSMDQPLSSHAQNGDFVGAVLLHHLIISAGGQADLEDVGCRVRSVAKARVGVPVVGRDLDEALASPVRGS